VATEQGTDDQRQQASVPMRAELCADEAAGRDGEEFVEILPFTPANRNNLIGWIAGAVAEWRELWDGGACTTSQDALVDGPPAD